MHPLLEVPIKPSYEGLGRDLTREEAMLAAGDGRKLTHTLLKGEGSIRGVGGKFIQVGVSYRLPWDSFWRYRIGEAWETGWTLLNDLIIITKFNVK